MQFDEGRLTDGQGKTITCPEAVFVMTSNLVQDEISIAIANGYMLRPPISVLGDISKSTEAIRQLGGITTTPLQIAAADKAEKTGTPTPSEPAISATLPPSTVSVEAPTPIPPTSNAVSSVMSRVASDTERFLRFVVHPILKRAFHRDEFIGRINEMVIFHPFSEEDLQKTVRMELNRWAQRAKARHQIELEFSPRLVQSLTHNFDERSIHALKSIHLPVSTSLLVAYSCWDFCRISLLFFFFFSSLCADMVIVQSFMQ
jgi:ATP-dependent Clp protease ATP-binding subunit ClpB